MRGTRTNEGFTLVELLVVIAIIGILASVILVSLNTARQKARDARRISDIHQLSLALENYNDDNGQYPNEGLGDTPPPVLVTNYIAVIPTDPQNNPYTYKTTTCPNRNNRYVLKATLELGTNPALDNDVDGTVCSNVNCDDLGGNYCIMP